MTIPTTYLREKAEALIRHIDYLEKEQDIERQLASLVTIHQLANMVRNEAYKWRGQLRPTTLIPKEVP